MRHLCIKSLHVTGCKRIMIIKGLYYIILYYILYILYKIWKIKGINQQTVSSLILHWNIVLKILLQYSTIWLIPKQQITCTSIHGYNKQVNLDFLKQEWRLKKPLTKNTADHRNINVIFVPYFMQKSRLIPPMPDTVCLVTGKISDVTLNHL
jgi:hypothetical protein